VATPADWRPGDNVIIGLGVDDAQAGQRLADYTAVKAYPRPTPQSGGRTFSS
jgi:hypothetical protein